MSKKKATAISLPLSRTAKIMTSAVGVESVNHDIVALATKATVSYFFFFFFFSIIRNISYTNASL